jgi:hypothetical protein
MYQTDNALTLGLSGKLGGMQDIAGFAASILDPHVFLSFVIDVQEIDGWVGRESDSRGRDPYHSDRARRGRLGSTFQNWSQIPGEEEVSDIVSPQLKLISLRGLGALAEAPSLRHCSRGRPDETRCEGTRLRIA